MKITEQKHKTKDSKQRLESYVSNTQAYMCVGVELEEKQGL